MMDNIRDMMQVIRDAPVALHCNKELIVLLEAQFPKRNSTPTESTSVLGMPIVKDEAFDILRDATGVIFKTVEARTAWIEASRCTRQLWMVHGDETPVAMRADGTWITEPNDCPDGLVFIRYSPDAAAESSA